MKNPEFKILSRKIGENYIPIVIVEIGINHGGSLIVAKKMVDKAVEGGAEIQHQTHIIEDEMSKAAKNVIPGNSKKSIYEIMKNNSLDKYEELELQNYVHEKGKIFISTPFSLGLLQIG